MIKTGILSVGFSPVVATAVAAATDASPLEYGIVGLVLIVGLIPIIRWMMSRMDAQQKEAADTVKRREDREDKNLEVMTKLTSSLSALTESNRAILIKLESLPSELSRLVNGG